MSAYPKVRLQEDGILRVDFGQHADITLDVMKRVHAKHRELCGDLATPVLVTGEGALSADYYAQKYAAGAEVGNIVTASAMVARSVLGRHFARAMMEVHEPPFPVRLFDSEDEALAWLREFRAGHASRTG